MALMPGFVKGQSDNLPKINSLTLFSFLGSNPDFVGAEIRGLKAQRSGRESYGDNAIGHVQLKRDADICIVNAKVTPEHSLRKKAYSVEFHCNEAEEKIISVRCNDCAASLGGCKHAVALLMWLHRRSEEPAVTSVKNYWKKSNLSCVGTTLKFIKVKDLVENRHQAIKPSDGSFLTNVLEKSRHLGRYDTVLTKYYKEEDPYYTLSIYHMSLSFFANKVGKTAEEFINFCSVQMSDALCCQATIDSVDQSESSLWHQMRYGRITASKAFEASNCHTMDGSLVETVLGAALFKDTAAMERGRKLESFVRKEVERQKNIKIKLCGFATNPEFPVLGASPDGLTADYIIEIKCPSSEKALESYIKNGKISDKFTAQMQLQMLFFKKKLGLFCVAAHDFETSKDVSILEVKFDENLCKDLIEKCTRFWKTAIFPILENNKSV